MIGEKLGVLGLGSRSTLYYLSELNRLYHQAKGDYSTCPFVLLNTDFNAINSLLPNSSKALDAILQTYIYQIEAFHIEQLLIPNITLHETTDRLLITKNVLHPVHLSLKKIKENNWTKVVLFGSLFSMNATYVKNQFITNGIEVILPSQEDMLHIDNVRKQIYNETETAKLIKKYHSIIHTYTVQHPVILSCTELSVLKPKGNNNLLDMADVQIEAAIKYSIS